MLRRDLLPRCVRGCACAQTELTPREQDVLRRRFGLGGAPELTLDEIGVSMSLSRERIRPIEANALRKLKARSRQKQLGTYLVQ
ncbi:hypothetical protein BE08_12220 [Sorangium cellulosum]|uniref:RNA polymerase sigma-70 region 4 domain-containing protein n=1 Tax=Sorangium cellulosum TaxID=56 RepID=A0A150PAM6_SORCE|nr:hypothetical protein BE08_12220 [Sorangium cellulosum]